MCGVVALGSPVGQNLYLRCRVLYPKKSVDLGFLRSNHDAQHHERQAMHKHACEWAVRYVRHNRIGLTSHKLGKGIASSVMFVTDVKIGFFPRSSGEDGNNLFVKSMELEQWRSWEMV